MEKRNKDNSGSSGGATKGNCNAAKIGEDLRFEMFLSKPRRMFFEEWFNLRFSQPPISENELRDVARQLANNAIDRAIIEEFERHQPGLQIAKRACDRFTHVFLSWVDSS